MELTVFPKDKKLTDATALWRISMANVTEDGPFSVLPAYDRIITVVEGNGFHLKGSRNTDRDVVQGSVYHFSGTEAIHCRLKDGPCVDLNIIYKKDSVRSANLELFGYGESSPPVISVEPCAGETIFVISLNGCSSVRLKSGKRHLLNPRDSLYICCASAHKNVMISREDKSRIALVRILTA